MKQKNTTAARERDSTYAVDISMHNMCRELGGIFMTPMSNACLFLFFPSHRFTSLEMKSWIGWRGAARDAALPPR